MTARAEQETTVTAGRDDEIRRADFHPLRGFKRRSKPMTPEQREAAAARLAAARVAREAAE